MSEDKFVRDRDVAEGGAVDRGLFRRHPRFSIAGAVTAFVFILAMVFGPVLDASDADPRPYAALLVPLYAVVLFAGVFWIATVVLRNRPIDRDGRLDAERPAPPPRSAD